MRSTAEVYQFFSLSLWPLFRSIFVDFSTISQLRSFCAPNSLLSHGIWKTSMSNSCWIDAARSLFCFLEEDMETEMPSITIDIMHDALVTVLFQRKGIHRSAILGKAKQPRRGMITEWSGWDSFPLKKTALFQTLRVLSRQIGVDLTRVQLYGKEGVWIRLSSSSAARRPISVPWILTVVSGGSV